MAAQQLLEKHLLDGAILEWTVSGCEAWTRCTELRCEAIVETVNGRNAYCNFQTGMGGSTMRYTYQRCQSNKLVFTPMTRFDAFGQRRRNVLVRAVESGELVLNLEAEFKCGRIQTTARSISGMVKWVGQYSVQGALSIADIQDAIERFLLRQKTITKYTKVRLVSGNAVLLKRSMTLYHPNRRGPVKFRVHGKTARIQTLITEFFKRLR